ncbi:lantibiotic biosynthesis dehydratase-like protein [Flavobacterium sp. 1]|uniref:lantibiotic dehydratase family protein n=1 Tax=Flavobacterium sp. 1 TaxID=2035200 RepID=UPI000C249A35|nr:lantibiotic dehydratase family protein [Flavobacterium sp. 1]PJJ09861.1 lantibiotic biosynthesis dehydratase-like protein [Flavobacterium sp. 1]
MNKYKVLPFQHYVLRTPLFPISFYSNLAANYSFENLLLQLENDYVREAIHLASPELLSALGKCKSNPSTVSDKKKLALELSFLKYLSRMSARCTPFGIFAGCTVGKITPETNITLESQENHSRHTQFDMQFWVALLQDFSRRKEVIPHLKYYPNTSIYELGNFYRFVEYKYIKTKREHHISAIRKSDLLALLLAKTKSGITVPEMICLLADDGSETEEALEYINQLIDFQFLVSELDATVTGDDDWGSVFTILNKIPALKEECELLQKIKEQFSALDASLNPFENKYEKIKTEIQKLGIEYDNKYLFQTDLNTTDFVNTLSDNVSRKVLQAIRFLNGIQKQKESVNQIHFIKAFTKRYESREMPLTTVLDTETGIGYLQNQEMNDTHDLLEQFSFATKISDEKNQNWTDFDFILETKLQESLLKKENIITLSEKDFPEFDHNWNNAPATFSVMIECLRKDEREIIAIESSGSISAAKLLARFCNGNKAIHNLSSEIIQKETIYHKDKILAEIVHIPESRTGNILRRPVLREFEIPYLSNSGVPAEYQIGLDDLMVSIKNDTIVLRSKKHNKEIIPCLSNAHNYSNKSLPIYHFLADLQSQNVKPIYSFSWGVLESHYNYFPRVVYRDIILSKARWSVTKKEMESFYKQNSSSLVEIFTIWRTMRNIPQYVNWIHFDNTLLIDFKNEIGIQLFLKSIQSQNIIDLEEFLFTEESVVKDKNGENFANQIILSFYKEQT